MTSREKSSDRSSSPGLDRCGESAGHHTKQGYTKVFGNFGSLLLTLLVAASAQAEGEAANETGQGILPVPDVSGDLWNRKYLTGDWAGTRDELAGRGIQFDAEYYQYVQDVVDGGVASGAQWGGKANYRLHLDLDRMGVMSESALYVRFDARWGDGVLGRTGQLLPANEAFLIPVDYDDLERETWGTLTALTFTQFFAPNFALFRGKIDNQPQLRTQSSWANVRF